MSVMFSPRRVNTLPIFFDSRVLAAPIASSTSSPGINRATLRRTNLYLVARSHSHLFCEAANSSDRITLMNSSREEVSKFSDDILGQMAELLKRRLTRQKLRRRK